MGRRFSCVVFVSSSHILVNINKNRSQKSPFCSVKSHRNTLDFSEIILYYIYIRNCEPVHILSHILCMEMLHIRWRCIDNLPVTYY